MREILSAAVSAVLLSAAACTTQPSAPEKATAARPADAKGVAAGGSTDALVIPDGWTLVYSRGGFRAAFPSRPLVMEKPLKTEAGWVRLLSHDVTMKDGSGDLSVIVATYPNGTMSGKPAEQALEDAGDRILAQHKLTLVTDKPVKVDGPKGGDERSFPGRDLEAIQESEGMRVSIRVFLVNDRVFQIMFRHKDEKTEPFEQFLSTFSLHSFGSRSELQGIGFPCCGPGSAD